MLFLNASQPALIGSYLTPIFALIGVLLGLSGTFLMNRINQIQKKKDDKKNKINNQLQNFYYPFIHLQKKSEELYLLFNNNKEKDFQTLLYLLEYGQAGLTQNDLTLLTKIIEVGQQWSNLILEKSNFVDNIELQKDLSKLSVHLTVLDLAQKGLLKLDTSRFKDYVFPKGIVSKIKKEIISLESQLN